MVLRKSGPQNDTERNKAKQSEAEQEGLHAEQSPDVPALLPLVPEAFRAGLATWYGEHARDLPWRGVHDPYATWLSEIMLQQTRVATVIDRYVEFLRKFPTLAALAMADESDVLALWSGLGYYRRARMLHRASQFVMRELSGRLPYKSQDLRTLPGVGEYTAAAIASIAFGESIPVVDGNVERVLLRILGISEDGFPATRNRIKETAKDLVPAAVPAKSRVNPPGTHNQAMMELGATICLPRQPLCLQCPVMAFCKTRGEHGTLKRSPQKSRVVAHLLALRKNSTATEVLLERRPADASLMPGMLELPPLPLDAVEGREPVLRLRHAITNTNYYVQVYTQGVVGGGHAVATLSDAWIDQDEEPGPGPFQVKDALDEELFSVDPHHDEDAHPLLQALPVAKADLRWIPASRLQEFPLTGLARKALQRLGLMRLPTVRVR